MNNKTSTDVRALKKIAVILATAMVLIFLGLWVLLYNLGNESIRQFTSYFQPGTQVYFDEGYFHNQFYAAKVTAYLSGRKISFAGKDFVMGSTLPDTNETNQYPTVAAAAISFKRGTHYGGYTNEVYQRKDIPALILNPGAKNFVERQGRPIRTIADNISPFAGDNYRQKQASQVHVHGGRSAVLRGSTACLTIAPEQAQSFFASEISETGTIHIRR